MAMPIALMTAATHLSAFESDGRVPDSLSLTQYLSSLLLVWSDLFRWACRAIEGGQLSDMTCPRGVPLIPSE